MSDPRSDRAEQIAIDFSNRFILANFQPGARRILEVGCGRGALAAQLARNGLNITALDRSPDVIREAQSRGVNAHCADWITYADGQTYDAIVFIRSLHHIEPLAEAVRRAALHLTPHGRLLADEFAVDEIDAQTADWLQRELRAAFHEDPPAGSLAQKLLDAPPSARSAAAESSAALEIWRDHHAHHAPIHTAAELRDALEHVFGSVTTTTGPYLFRYAAIAGSATSAAAVRALLERETAAIAAGAIRPVGRRFVADGQR